METITHARDNDEQQDQRIARLTLEVRIILERLAAKREELRRAIDEAVAA
jgi:hypothetical protein